MKGRLLQGFSARTICSSYKQYFSLSALNTYQIIPLFRAKVLNKCAESAMKYLLFRERDRESVKRPRDTCDCERGIDEGLRARDEETPPRGETKKR